MINEKIITFFIFSNSNCGYYHVSTKNKIEYHELMSAKIISFKFQFF